MFVECFSGLMGGGKSFYSVHRMARHIAGGGIVFSNIKFELDPWFNEAYADQMKSFWRTDKFEGCRVELHKDGSVSPVTKTDEKGVVRYQYNSCGLKHFLRVQHKWNYQEGQYHYIKDEDVNADLPSLLPKGGQGQPVLVLLDEALDHFESDGTSSNATKEFRSFLRHIRKLGINLIFIAQDFGSLDKKIRMLTHFVWKFRDMYTWPVPIFNRPLPAPWKNHIICEKYHRSQFGKIKAESINKDNWVYRDPLVFGCYQSIATHNAKIKMADDMKTDFGTEGNIRKGKRKMNILERAALFLCLIMAGIGAFKKPSSVVVQSSAVESADQSDSGSGRLGMSGEDVPTTSVLYERFRFAELNGEIRRIVSNGVPYEVGDITPLGTVLAISSKHIHIRKDNGSDTFIYPSASHLQPSKGSVSGERVASSVGVDTERS